jgi:recombination protein RecT
MPELVKLSTKIETTRALLDRMKAQLALALPKHLSADRLARVVMTECLASVQRGRPGAPTLLDCTAESFASAVLQAAAFGLEPGALGQVHLIPRRNSRRGTVECTFQIGYKGILALVYRSGQILTIDPVVVYARDRYEIRKGTNRSIRHDPYRPTSSEDSPGDAVAYYAVADIRGGGTKFVDAWRSDIERHRDRYAATRGEGSPWDTHFDEMALKTVLKRLCKYLPVSVEVATAVALDDAAEAGIPQDFAWLGQADAPLEVPGELCGVEFQSKHGEMARCIKEAGHTADHVGERAPAEGSSKLDAAVADRKRRGESPEAVA